METNLDLTNDEQNILESIYGRQSFGISGYSPHGLESVKELTAREKKFFTGKNFVPSHFFVQTLYKVRGAITPIKFTVTVNRMIAANEDLRSNFCNLGTRTVKVVHPATFVKPEIIFRNLVNVAKDELDDELAKIFAADTRRETDIKHDPLIRLSVYKTGAEEFAVFVTLAQIIFDSFNAEEFFSNLADLPLELNPKKIHEELPTKNVDMIREYWAKILYKAPSPLPLPYERKSSKGIYRQRAFQAIIPEDLTSDLLANAQSNRMMFIAILQSAWGFMLQLTNKRRDCLFCQIAASEDSSFNVIPVRLSSPPNETVEKIVRNQFRQLIISQPYGLSDWTTLDELTVQKRLFDHFINFKQFTLNESGYENYPKTPAEPLGKVIFRASWDSQDMKFGAYFRYSKKKLLVGFIYDAEKFSNNGVAKLYDIYLLVLQHMVTDWNAKYNDFASRLAERIEIYHEDEVATAENEQRDIRNFLAQLPILQGRFGGTIGLFERHAKLIPLYEGDRISSDMLKENFIFIVDGIISRNVDTGDGWYNTLDIIERNAFLNPTSLLEEQLFKISATVLTDKAELLTIPHNVFIEILHKNPETMLSVLSDALKQMERYQFLWLQS